MSPHWLDDCIMAMIKGSSLCNWIQLNQKHSNLTQGTKNPDYIAAVVLNSDLN